MSALDMVSAGVVVCPPAGRVVSDCLSTSWRSCVGVKRRREEDREGMDGRVAEGRVCPPVTPPPISSRRFAR